MNQGLYLHGLIGGTNSNPSTPEPTPWERPADWLSVPDLVDGTHKIYALVKLVDGTDHNYVSFSSDQDNSDGFHVDWGDGTEEQAPSGDGSYSVEHYYDFDQISNDSLTSDGYKQAVITITSSTGFAAGLYSNFTDNRSNIILELKINSSTWNNTQILCEAEHIVIGQNAIPSWNSVFANFQQLKCCSVTETLDTCTDFSGMFGYCNALTTIPLLDTSSGTNFSYMFSSCYALTTIPLLDTSSGTDFSGMFGYCNALTTIPLLDTSSGTNFNSMFSSCYALTTIPLLNTSSGTDFSGMFGYCNALTTIPLLDTSSGTNFSYMFYNCDALKILGMINIPNVSFSLADSYLDRDQIVNIFNELSVGTSTITLSYKTLGQSNPEITNGDVEIATNKGWTVTS